MVHQRPEIIDVLWPLVNHSFLLTLRALQESQEPTPWETACVEGYYKLALDVDVNWGGPFFISKMDPMDYYVLSFLCAQRSTDPLFYQLIDKIVADTVPQRAIALLQNCYRPNVYCLTALAKKVSADKYMAVQFWHTLIAQKDSGQLAEVFPILQHHIKDLQQNDQIELVVGLLQHDTQVALDVFEVLDLPPKVLCDQRLVGAMVEDTMLVSILLNWWKEQQPFLSVSAQVREQVSEVLVESSWDHAEQVLAIGEVFPELFILDTAFGVLSRHNDDLTDRLFVMMEKKWEALHDHLYSVSSRVTSIPNTALKDVEYLEEYNTRRQNRRIAQTIEQIELQGHPTVRKM